MSWYLENVYKRNEEAPYTFWIPSEEILAKLKVGDLVKLIFVPLEEYDDGFTGERMWVQIPKWMARN